MKKLFYIVLIFIYTILNADDNNLVFNSFEKYLTTAEKEYIKNKKVIIASNEYDYEPMDFNVDGIPLGFSIDLLDLLANKAGLKVQYVTKSWIDLVDSFEKGEIDILHPIYKSQEREKKYVFSTPFLVSENYFITKKDNNVFYTFDNLKGKKFGVSKYWHEESVVKRYPKIKMVYFKNLREKLEALSLGKIDIFMNDKNIANYYIKKYGYTDLKVSNHVVESNNNELDKYYFSALKNNSTLISILNKAYMHIDIDLLKRLQDKWFGKNEKFIFDIKEQNYLDKRGKIKVCVFPDIMPLSDIHNGEAQGIVADILKEIKLNTNIEFETIKTNTLKETFEFLKDKECDILPSVEHSQKNSKFFNLTKIMFEMPYVAIGTGDKEFFSDLSELKNKKISVISYTSLIKELKDQYPSIEIISVKTIEDGLDLVKEGKVYAHLTLYPIARYYKAKNNYNTLKILGRLIKPMKISMAVVKDDPILINIMNKAIGTIPPSKIESILNNWIDIKIQKVVDYSLLLKILGLCGILTLLGLWRYSLLKRANIEIKNINDKLHKYQNDLLKQKEEFEAIFRYSKDGIAILDFDFKFIDCNSSYLKMLGYNQEEISGRSFIETLSKEEREGVEMILNDVIENGSIDNYEKVCLGKNGKRVSINIAITVMPDKARLLLTTKDVTSTKLLESQSKLASMGEMIGNIAHQWRQPLSVISTSASGLSLKAEMQDSIKSSEIVEFSSQIVEQAKYLSKTIDDFRNFIKDDLNFQAISVKEALENALIITKAAIRSNYVELILNIDDDMIINGNRNELGQAFINIINNSKDKLKDLDEKNHKRYLFISTIRVDKKILEIKFLDNGGGVDENIIDRIFEPYFTTKHQSVGTGLGLSMSEKIIRQRHHGSIQVYNENFFFKDKEYKGACFVVRLYS